MAFLLHFPVHARRHLSRSHPPGNLGKEMERDPTVFCLGEDIGIYGRRFPKSPMASSTDFGPEARDRYSNCGVGHRRRCLRSCSHRIAPPVAEFQFMDFIGCAFNQIVQTWPRRAHYRWGAPAPAGDSWSKRRQCAWRAIPLAKSRDVVRARARI